MELAFSPPVLTSHKGAEHGTANRQALLELRSKCTLRVCHLSTLP